MLTRPCNNLPNCRQTYFFTKLTSLVSKTSLRDFSSIWKKKKEKFTILKEDWISLTSQELQIIITKHYLGYSRASISTHSFNSFCIINRLLLIRAFIHVSNITLLSLNKHITHRGIYFRSQLKTPIKESNKY